MNELYPQLKIEVLPNNATAPSDKSIVHDAEIVLGVYEKLHPKRLYKGSIDDALSMIRKDSENFFQSLDSF